jgi:predicted membrane metal-binding protein
VLGPVLADLPIVLALSPGDAVERFFPLVLFAFAVVLVVVRRRDRKRGPDDEDDIDD